MRLDYYGLLLECLTDGGAEFIIMNIYVYLFRIMKPLRAAMDTFLDRLNFVLADRTLASIGSKLGWSTGTQHLVRHEDKVPGHDLMYPISDIENVSLHWLLKGDGAPFLVNEFGTSDEAVEYLDELFLENWAQFWLIRDGEHTAFALRNPIEIQRKNRSISFWNLELIVAPTSPEVSKFIQNQQSKLGEVFSATVARPVMSQLRKGQLGSYALFDNAKSDVFDTKQSITVTELIMQLRNIEGEDNREIAEWSSLLMQLPPDSRNQILGLARTMVKLSTAPAALQELY